MLLTFVPWKSNGMKPSVVVALCDKLRSPGSALHVMPYWYGLNVAASNDLYAFRQADAMKDWKKASSLGRVGVDLKAQEPTSVIVVFAKGAKASSEETDLRYLQERYPWIDSVQTDPKVWVYRFRK